MSSVVISGDTSGAITLSAPAVSGTNTATLPAATGTVMVSGNMPAFKASGAGGQSISSNTNTKVVLGVSQFDTASCFNTSTYRYTPNVAGYYFFTGCVSIANASYTLFASILKNGSSISSNTGLGASAMYPIAMTSTLVYMNGSTDYVELYVQTNSGSATTIATQLVLYDALYFTGYLARTA